MALVKLKSLFAKETIMYTLLGTEDSDYESKFIRQLERKAEPSRRGVYIMTALFTVLLFQTTTIDTLNQTSSYLGALPTSHDSDVIGFIVSLSRLIGCLLGAVLSLILSCRVTVPVLLYGVSVFSTCMGMPAGKEDVMTTCVLHMFQAFGTGLIETQAYFLVYKMWDKMAHRAIALQFLATSSALAGFLCRFSLHIPALEKRIIPSVTWTLDNRTITRTKVDGTLPTMAIIFSVSTILISASLIAMNQLFPTDFTRKSAETKSYKKKTFLAFFFPALAVALLTVNHVTVEEFSTNHIRVLANRGYSILAAILFTIFSIISSVTSLNLINTLALRSMLYAMAVFQIAASVSFLIGHNVAVVIATAMNIMAIGSACISATALLWATAFHNQIHVLICTIVVAKSGLSEGLYFASRLLIAPDVGGRDGWIFATSIYTLVFATTVYLGNFIMERITKKESEEIVI